MNKIEKDIDIVIREDEGGYIETWDKYGGKTYAGISIKDNPTAAAINTPKMAINWYKIWLERVGIDSLREWQRKTVISAAILVGPQRAVKILQKSLNMRGKQIDGIWGPKTKRAVQIRPWDSADYGVHWVLDLLEHTNENAENKYMHGWLNRIKRRCFAPNETNRRLYLR